MEFLHTQILKKFLEFKKPEGWQESATGTCTEPNEFNIKIPYNITLFPDPL
jgi:hypothetical protein